VPGPAAKTDTLEQSKSHNAGAPLRLAKTAAPGSKYAWLGLLAARQQPSLLLQRRRKRGRPPYSCPAPLPGCVQERPEPLPCPPRGRCAREGARRQRLRRQCRGSRQGRGTVQEWRHIITQPSSRIS
jgi:hypothetical protein